MPIQDLGDSLGAFIDWARGLFGAVQDEVTGSIDTTVQAILDIKEMDCGGNWAVYVKTAIPAAGAALYLLIIPSFEEILENYLEPKAGRRGGRRGRGRERERRPNRWGARRLFFTPPIPDVDELIADRIVGRGFFKGRSVGPGEWLFWTGINVADSVLWHWLLLEATETFVTEWQSGILESGQCVEGGPGYAKLVTPEKTPANFSWVWSDNTTLDVKIEKNMTIGNNGFVSIDLPYHASIGWCAAETTYTLTNDHKTETDVYQCGFLLKIYDNTGALDIVVEKQATISVAPKSTASGTATGFSSFNHHKAWEFQWRIGKISGGGATTMKAVGSLNIQAEGLASV